MTQRSGETRASRPLAETPMLPPWGNVSYHRLAKGRLLPSLGLWGKGAQHVRGAPSELPFYHF